MKNQLSVYSLLTMVSLVAASDGGAIDLTMANFESTLAGKNGFVKFFAPWCGHCKSMKPAWDQLGGEYAGSSSVVIGDADCTDSAKEICEKLGVSGYPTIKYFKDGDVSVGEPYKGGRDYDSLKKFVENELEVKCDANNVAQTDCSDKEKDFIDKMKGKTAEERKKQLTRLQNMKDGKMKPDLKQWLMQRIRILTTLGVADGDEL
jgi:protein disulfide-isomerase A6